MQTVLSIYGDWCKQTDEASDLLDKTDIRYRVCLTKDYPGTVILSCPFGDVVGLDAIRRFVASAIREKEKENE